MKEIQEVENITSYQVSLTLCNQKLIVQQTDIGRTNYHHSSQKKTVLCFKLILVGWSDMLKHRSCELEPRRYCNLIISFVFKNGNKLI